jgi:hypothetical protein
MYPIWARSSSSTSAIPKCRVRIFDVSDPHAAQPLGRLPLEGWLADVLVDADLAYVSNGGLTIIDISDPTRPSVRGTLAPTLGDWWASRRPRSFYGELAILGDSIVAGESLEPALGAPTSRISLIDVRNPALPIQRGSMSLPGADRSVVRSATTEGLVWLARFQGGLVGVRVTPWTGARHRRFLPAVLNLPQ